MKTRIGVPAPAGEEHVIVRFSPDVDAAIAQDGMAEIEGGWRFVTNRKRTFRILELTDPMVEDCVLTYRAEMRCRDLEQPAYLEMWCLVPGEGNFFTKGVHHAVKGSSGWTPRETHIPFRGGHKPDQIRLNLTIEGHGVVEIRNVRLTTLPLPEMSTSRRSLLTGISVLWRIMRFAAVATVNVLLVIPQLVLAVVSPVGGPDEVHIWSPKKRKPEIGKVRST